MTQQKLNWTYEEASKRLEKVVQQLEEGELGLERSLEYFEEAVKLVKHCQKLLTQAEQKISVLVEDEAGNPILEKPSFSEE